MISLALTVSMLIFSVDVPQNEAPFDSFSLSLRITNGFPCKVAAIDPDFVTEVNWKLLDGETPKMKLGGETAPLRKSDFRALDYKESLRSDYLWSAEFEPPRKETKICVWFVYAPYYLEDDTYWSMEQSSTSRVHLRVNSKTAKFIGKCDCKDRTSKAGSAHE